MTDTNESILPPENTPTPEVSELDLLRAQEKQTMDMYLRLAADYKNYQNRVAKDIQLAVEQSERKIIIEMIKAIDALDRFFVASYTSTEFMSKDIALIHKQLADSLKRLQIESVPIPIGAPFDSSVAEALTTAKDLNYGDQTVLSVLEKGYTHRSRLLRPARVIVNKIGDTEVEEDVQKS